MNPLLAKEIRLLLPAFAMALLLAVAPVWLLRSFPEPAGIAVYLYGFGVVMLALSSFGREFGLKTFPVMLAQPLSRRRVWWTKVTVLACAMAAAFGAWSLSCQAFGKVGFGKSLRETMTVAGLISLVAFAGGLWTTILLRQVAAAFWFTILVPVAILEAISQNGGGLGTIEVALVLYSAAGFWWAWRQFLRAQETARTGGEITFSKPQSVDAGSRLSGRTRRPISALMAKELQLLQVALAGMGGLFLLHLGVLALRKAGQNALGEMTRVGLESFWLLWFPVPLLAGCTSVAEERRLGTMQGLMCEPISSRVQYAIKLLFVVLLGGLLSGLFLWVAEGIGTKVGAGSYNSEFSAPFDPEALAMLFFLFAAISLIGFYASTLARNLMQALAIAVVTCIVFALPMANGTRLPNVLGIPAWRWELANYVEWPMLVGTLFWLAYGNFKRFSEDWRLWLRNLLGLTAALVLIPTLAAGLYHRAWELLTPLEPPHGLARLTGVAPPNLAGNGNALAVLLPDGRLWTDRVIFQPGRKVIGFGKHYWVRLSGKWASLTGGHFVSGSNWVSIATGFLETVGIRSDGTLWVSAKPSSWRGNAGFDGDPDRLVRFGDETNWQSVVWDNSSRSVLLLKRGGTLWRWGTNYFDSHLKWPGFRSFEPYRLGTESDWAEIRYTGTGMFAWKKEGSAWLMNTAGKGTNNRQHELEPGRKIERREDFDRTGWSSLTEFGTFRAGVREDGTLWAWSLSLPMAGRVLAGEKVQFGMNTNWVVVAIYGSKLVALKADGSLWKWEIGYSQKLPICVLRESPVRLGTHNDWVALSSVWDGFVSLAADGSLWVWWARDYTDDQPLLGVSRRPMKIAELFSKGE